MVTTKIAVALLAGVAVGAALGVLFAPEKGSELRHNLADKAKDILGKAFSSTNGKESVEDVSKRGISV